MQQQKFMNNMINPQEENSQMDPSHANFMFSQMANKMNLMPNLNPKLGQNLNNQNASNFNMNNMNMSNMNMNVSNTNNNQMQNIDLFMNNVIHNITNNNMPNIPPANIQAIQKMLESQNESGNPNLQNSLPLNTNTNNNDLNNVNNIANNFGNLVEAINTYNNRHINHNNNIVSTVNNLTGVLSKSFADQEKQNLGIDQNGDPEDKKEESNNFK